MPKKFGLGMTVPVEKSVDGQFGKYFDSLMYKFADQCNGIYDGTLNIGDISECRAQFDFSQTPFIIKSYVGDQKSSRLYFARQCESIRLAGGQFHFSINTVNEMDAKISVLHSAFLYVYRYSKNNLPKEWEPRRVLQRSLDNDESVKEIIKSHVKFIKVKSSLGNDNPFVCWCKTNSGLFTLLNYNKNCAALVGLPRFQNNEWPALDGDGVTINLTT